MRYTGRALGPGRVYEGWEEFIFWISETGDCSVVEGWVVGVLV